MRTRFIIIALALLGVVTAPACSEDTATTGGGDKGQLPCAVSEVLQDNCQSCHAADTKFGAPMSLVTRQDLLATALDGQSSVAERSVARMQASDGRMPPPPNEAANADQIAVLQQWIDAGHPARAAGEMCNDGSGGAGGGGGSPGGCEPDLVLTAPQAYEMPANLSDSQVCFGIDVPAYAAKRHITTIAPRIDNDKIIHHILFMQAPESVSPDPTPCNFTQQDWKLLYAWGPGTPAHVLPDEAGFPIDSGDTVHFVLQVHYNNLQGLVGETDQSGVELCTTEDLRQYDADVMAFGGSNISLSPGATTQMTCDLTIPAEVGPFFPVTIFQSWPHMHQLGTGMNSEIRRPNSSVDTLVNIDDYSFEYQITYPNDNIQLNVGDMVRTQCTWNNTTANTVGFGENTANEMCFNFVSYYPRINSPAWSWLLPAAPSQFLSCSSEIQ